MRTRRIIDSLTDALETFRGRRPTGDPTRITFEQVRAKCHRCGCEMTIPVHFGEPRRTVPCARCGVDV